MPDELRERAAVYILGQNPGEQEEQQGKPYVGPTGMIMEREFLKVAGLTRDDVSIGNAIRCRRNHSNDLPPVTEVITRDATAHCTRAHGRIPSGTRLVVTQGDYAALAATGSHSSTEWRGYVVPHVSTPESGQQHSTVWTPVPTSLPVLVTVHIARLFRERWLKFPTKLDWSKIPRILRRSWPRRPPSFRHDPIETWPQRFAFDTEFYTVDPSGLIVHVSNKLQRYSLAWGTQDDETAVIEADAHATPGLPMGKPRVVTQYAPADVRHLANLAGLMPRDVWRRFLIDDTVIKHAALYPDQPHDLDFLGSLFASFNRWKHLSDTDPVLYAGCDALGTLEIDNALEREFDRDPVSRKVYEGVDRPTIEVFTEAQYAGIRTDQRRVREVLDQLQGDIDDAQARATATVGWPINLSSNPQVSYRLFVVDGLTKSRGGSKRKGKK